MNTAPASSQPIKTSLPSNPPPNPPDQISQVRNPLDPDSVNRKIAPPPTPEKKPVVSLKTGPKFPDPTSAVSMPNVPSIDAPGKKKPEGQGKKSKAGIIIGGIILLFGLIAGLYFGVMRPQDIRREAAGGPCSPPGKQEWFCGIVDSNEVSMVHTCQDSYLWTDGVEDSSGPCTPCNDLDNPNDNTTCTTGGDPDPEVCDAPYPDNRWIEMYNDSTCIRASNPSANGGNCLIPYTVNRCVCEDAVTDTACNELNGVCTMIATGNLAPGDLIEYCADPAICTTVQVDIDLDRDGGGVKKVSDVQGDACEPGQDILSCSSLTSVVPVGVPVGGTATIISTCIGEFSLSYEPEHPLDNSPFFYFHYTNATGALAGHEFIIGSYSGIGNTWSAKSQGVTLAEGSKYYSQCFICNGAMQDCEPGSLYYTSGPDQHTNVPFPPDSSNTCVREIDLTSEPTIPPTVPPTVPPTPEPLACNSACSYPSFDPNAQECPEGLVCECPSDQVCPTSGGLCVNPICPDAPESANCVCPGSPVLACTYMDSTPAAPELGDTVTLTCSADYYYSPVASPNLHFRFFLSREATPDNIDIINGESVDALPADTADKWEVSSWAASLQSPALTDGGTYFASCQICDSQNYCNPGSITTN